MSARIYMTCNEVENGPGGDEPWKVLHVGLVSILI